MPNRTVHPLAAFKRSVATPLDYVYRRDENMASLEVSPQNQAAVLKLVRSGVYHSVDEVLETALNILQWAENHPDGKRELLRHALQSANDEDYPGNLIDAEEVFRKARERARGEEF